MIGYIRGKAIDVSNNYIIILTESQVGYKVYYSYEDSIILEGEDIEAFIYTNVRENEISLYGFKNKLDLDIFEQILTISGIGPKGAYLIISKHGAKGVINAVLRSNSEGLRVSGVGAKTAEKIVLELKDKFIKKGYSEDGESKTMTSSVVNMEDSKYKEIENAFIALGFSKNEIKAIIADIVNENSDIDKVEDFIREGLRRA